MGRRAKPAKPATSPNDPQQERSLKAPADGPSLDLLGFVGHAARSELHRATRIQAGLMFWLTRKRFSGSTAVLIAASRG